MNELVGCVAMKGKRCEHFTFKDNPRFFCAHLKAIQIPDRDEIPALKCSHPEVIVEQIMEDLV